MRYAIFAGFVMTGALAFGQNVAQADRKFVTDAAQGGMMEVELGKVAADKAQNADVKTFGQRMVDDHSKANDQLKQVAASKNITLPADLDAKHKADMQKVTGAADFDRAYMRHMVVDHRKDVNEFSRASKTAKDPDVKKFAADTLPTLQDHLKQAQSIEAQLGGAKGKGKGAMKEEKK